MRIPFVLFLLLFFFSSFAQEQKGNSSITGQVKDQQQQHVPFAAVVLYNAGDSTIAKGSSTDENGNFNILAEPGKYYLQISFLSYKTKVIAPLLLTEKPLQLGTINLQNDALSLNEITVAAEKKQMELKLDKRVFNVSKDLSNTATNASEVLENIPSVAVDVDGNVSLRGSENVRILIDGKPSGLIGISSTEVLRQMQGNMIEKIEIITNPSARYDAEGEVGIINIVLKKENQNGVNGSFDVFTGYPDNHGASYSLNFRRKKFNFFSAVGVAYIKNPGNGTTKQEFYNASEVSLLNSDREHTRGGISGNFRLGADYELNKFNTVTVAALYQNSENDNEAQLIYNYLDSNNVRLETVNRNEDEQESREVIEGTVNYERSFKQKDRKWTSNVKWMQSTDLEQAKLNENSNISSKKPLIQRTDNTENEKNWLFQSDYVHPFKKEGKAEIGAKATLREIDNDFLLEERASDGTFNPVSSFDNHFIYTENIFAAYGMLGNKIGQLSYQFGLRWEYSDISADLIETAEKNTYHYHNFFPSAHFSYEMKKSNTVQLSYSRRISRPRFRHLLPFYGYSDSRNIYSGNPELQPEFSNSYELGHLKYWKKGSLLSSVYYRRRTAVVERINVSDSVGFTRRFPVNLATQDAFGAELNASYQPFKWWRVSSGFNFYRAITDGKYLDQRLHSDTYTWNGKGNSKFTLNKTTDLQISANYQAPRETTQGKNKSTYYFNVGLSKEVLKNKGTISLNVTDVFNSRKRRSITDVEDFYSVSEFQWRSRQFRINFNYRLNQKKKRDNAKGKGSDGFGGDDDL
jgi:outer membrane receptor protein involved in Fe transport